MSIYTIKNEMLTVSVSDLGAELQSIKGADGTEFLWQGDNTYWSDRAPVLFPYIARLTDGKYYLDGKLHRMSIHGFALSSVFSVKAHSAGSIVFELKDTPETYVQYPRKFAFRVCYKVIDASLHICFEVDNLDEKEMYFSVGGHPGFCVPLDEGKHFSEYFLRFPYANAPTRIGFTEKCFLNGKLEPFPLSESQTLPLRHEMFDDDAIVLTDTGHTVVLESSSGHFVKVDFPGMDYLGIWHRPKTDAPYVCLEPWCALPSTQNQIAVFEQQDHMIHLPENETYRNEWIISIGVKNPG